jgi:hypothetical protein
MKKRVGIAGIGGTAIAGLALVLAPAMAASVQTKKASNKRPRTSLSLLAGSFTPAVADPRLAAEFARRGFQTDSLRFTPATTSADRSKAIKVAVRARAATVAQAARTVADASSSTPVTAVTPTGYNLGVAVGWKRFALSGDVAKVEGGAIPGGREAAEVGVSYAGKKFTGRLQLGAERADPAQLRIVPVESSYSLDVGGSYRIGRNLDVTGGVRYKIEHERLEPVADQRRDSQAVYIGTAFRF